MKWAILHIEYFWGFEWGLGIMIGEFDQVLYNNMRVSEPSKKDIEWKAKKTTPLILSRAR